jgi:nitrite reductase (NADH) small subunit
LTSSAPAIHDRQKAPRHVVGRVSEMPPGSVRIVQVNNPQGVGVFNVGGTYYALKNVCPHQGGPLCSGPITGTTRARLSEDGAPDFEWIRDGEIVRCPWHRWEFDIATGKTVFESRLRVAKYRVTVDPEPPRQVETFRVTAEDGLVILEL